MASDDDSFPAIDSFSRQGIFQFTVAQVHPIRGVLILKRLCSDPKIYFVVPPHRFEKFKKQKLLSTRSNSAVGDIPELKQFVLELAVAGIKFSFFKADQKSFLDIIRVHTFSEKLH